MRAGDREVEDWSDHARIGSATPRQAVARPARLSLTHAASHRRDIADGHSRKPFSEVKRLTTARVDIPVNSQASDGREIGTRADMRLRRGRCNLSEQIVTRGAARLKPQMCDSASKGAPIGAVRPCRSETRLIRRSRGGGNRAGPDRKRARPSRYRSAIRRRRASRLRACWPQVPPGFRDASPPRR